MKSKFSYLNIQYRVSIFNTTIKKTIIIQLIPIAIIARLNNLKKKAGLKKEKGKENFLKNQTKGINKISQ